MPTVKTEKDQYKLLKTVFAIAKHEKNISPAQLREAVPDWGFPRLSACSNADLRAIISRLKRWYVATARGHTCSQAQLDYMQRLWEIKSDLKSKASLESYLLNHFDENHARLMGTDKCGAVIQSLKKWS